MIDVIEGDALCVVYSKLGNADACSLSATCKAARASFARAARCGARAVAAVVAQKNQRLECGHCRIESLSY